MNAARYDETETCEKNETSVSQGKAGSDEITQKIVVTTEKVESLEFSFIRVSEWMSERANFEIA